MSLFSSQPQPAAAQPNDDIQTVETPMPGKYRVKVIRSKCIAAGSCVAIAPKVFEFDAQNIATVISQDELDDIKLLAAQSCPTMAIIVEDIETGKQIWPEVPAQK
jgi:ferredoxin